MIKELAKAYDPKLSEKEIYQKWEKSGYFNPDNLNLPEDAKSYTIVLPPPNITDKLHLGHSCMLAIEDLLIRYKRLRGYRTLWLPGTDHAAIATQNVVEKKLLKESGQTRHNLGREKFLEKVWEFLRETQSTILGQIKSMGASLDWSREAFTLDEKRAQAVRKMFVDMYKQGIIYQGERIVNWCPRCHSTLADDEIEYKEQTAKIYTFKYDSDFPFAIATTRPETKLGDTAVAVNPKDERYKKYIGQEIKANFCGQELNLKIIGDHNVEMEFGTGALGVTPAHSMVDWQMAEKNNLNIKKVISEDGLILDGYGDYSGLSVLEARDVIVEKLKEQGLLEKEEEVANNLSTCYRCSTAIEPLPSKQWFISVDKKLEHLGGLSLKERAILAAKNGEIKFVPERFNKRYLDWMENLHDWCISRQIWFGHRIPVWYKGEEVYCEEQDPAGEGYSQDPDTLDTWFSSGMWTFSTLGWPENYKEGEKSGDLKKFHPTQVLETGYEIITLWVSRMIMMSFFALGEIPFSDVYLHGMILDKNGKKMSKSKGNGIDPLEVIEKFGTDAVRLSLLIGSTPGNDSKLSEEKISTYRNFTNKLWNISRFILLSVENEAGEIKEENLTLADQWILNKLKKLISEVTEDLENYRFSPAGEKLESFTWNDLADWYLEASKFQNSSEKNQVLLLVLKDLLKLWHPFMPFVSEEIWQQFNSSLLMVESWPQAEAIKTKGQGEDFILIQNIISAIRNARSENKVEPSRKVQAIIYAGDKKDLLEKEAELIKNLKTGIKSLEIKESGEKISDAIFIALSDLEIYLLGAKDEGKEKERLEKERLNLEKLITNLETKLQNKEFIAKAPQIIVEQEQAKLENYRQELKKIKAL